MLLTMVQHRIERVFIVSIRKDIDDGSFKFPEPIELTKTMRDYLEPVVDEKYYMDNEKTKALIERLEEEGKI